MHNLKTHSTVSKSFRYLFAFSCNLINKKKRRKIIVFFDWTIFLRNYFSKPMKFEYYLLQLKLFQIRPITLFYGKPFFRFKKKLIACSNKNNIDWTGRTIRWFGFEGDFNVELLIGIWKSGHLHIRDGSLGEVGHDAGDHQNGGNLRRLFAVASRASVSAGIFSTHFGYR